MAEFNPDKAQQKIIDFYGGRALVLAAPGCGKTQLLSHRILKAYWEYNVPFEEMLCVTFTNRASREMRERIAATVGRDSSKIYIGNLHRFCMRYLTENSLVPLDMGLLDELDQEELLREICGDDKVANYILNGIMDTVNAIRERSLHLPKELCTHQFHERFKEMAYVYLQYMKDNSMMDFDDLMFRAYAALRDQENNPPRLLNGKYSWIQVDEVQDLNPLQHAIIDCLTAPGSTVVYLGDERQAIYSFLGAKYDSLLSVEKKCHGRVFFLSNNYRAPRYMVDMLNDFAADVLEVDASRLPTSTIDTHLDDGLTLIKAEDVRQETAITAALVRQIYNDSTESIAVLVRTNQTAQIISDALNEHKIAHTLITNRDMFKMVPFKTIYSHFCVAAMDTRFNEWARILFATKAVQRLSTARDVVQALRKRALTPADLMNYVQSSYLMEYVHAFANEEIVVFDTETTGLDIFKDDIIQIAACKLKNGKVVPDSEIDIIIPTDKALPRTLKDGRPNPMLESYRERLDNHSDEPTKLLLEPQAAFAFFVDYIGNAHLLGHNALFDINILKNNILRRCSGLKLPSWTVWDTLKISRLLDPDLRSHSLGALLEYYGIPGENTHRALDDVQATLNLAEYAYFTGEMKLEEQKEFLQRDSVQKIAKRLRSNYLPYYTHTAEKLYSNEITAENTFEFEFRYIYDKFLGKGYIKEIPHLQYMMDLFTKVVIKEDDKYFHQQLVGHLYELRTFNEADLFQNGIIKERVHIMTIHKSKGLEFDNVFIPDVSYGVFPHYRSRTFAEDARVLFVAMSRARKRLFISYVHHLSPFIKKHPAVMEHFYLMPETQRDILIKYEEKFVKFFSEGQ